MGHDEGHEADSETAESRDLKRKRDDREPSPKRKKKRKKKIYPKNPVRDLVDVPKRLPSSYSHSQLTPIAYKYSAALTPEECEECRDCYEYVVDHKYDKPGRARFGSDSENYGKVGGHKVCYLHKKGVFDDKCGKIVERMMRLAYDFDRDHKVLSNEAIYQTVEYIRYKEGDWVGWHTDLNGSVITIVIMLSKSSHYEGGDLEVKLKEGKDGALMSKDGKTLDVIDCEMEQGDAVVFLSQLQYHRVTPCTWGSRRTMILEVKCHKDDNDHHSDSSDSDSDGDDHKKRKERKKNYKRREADSSDEDARPTGTAPKSPPEDANPSTDARAPED